MTLVKYNPVLAPSTFSNLFDKFFHDSYNTQVHKFLPDVDLAESEQSFEIHAALPGLNKENIQIEVKNGILTLSGERKFVKEENDKKFHSVETSYGSFSRSFTLPDTANAEKIEAEFKNGILTIQIPKDEKKTLKAKIEIK